MYVVGAARLRAFWEKHPAAEAPLRALYALLSEGNWRTRAALCADLGAGDAQDSIELAAGGARIVLKVDSGASLALVEKVTADLAEGRRS